MKVTLKTGKVVELVKEFGPGEALKAAELAGTPASSKMSAVDEALLEFATVMGAVKTITDAPDPNRAPEAPIPVPKTIQQIVGDAVEPRELLLNFRKSFTDLEWAQLSHAFNTVYGDEKVKKEEVGQYEIQY